MFFILIRVIHVVASAFWAGGVILLAGYVEPSARALGPSGGQFMRQLSGPGRLSQYLSIVGGLSVLAGLYLYWVRSGGLNVAWITSPEGISISLGALTGLIALLWGGLVTGRATRRLAALDSEVAAAAGPPTEAQQADMAALQGRLRTGNRLVALLLTLSLVFMSLAEYA